VKELRALAAALTFMTRLPLGRFASHDPDDLRSSAAYFPVVGIVVGAIGASAYMLGRLIWPTPVAVLLSMIATVYFTGAFHEDALADTLDGFGGGRTPERVLEIMKDSRVGSYALVGVTLTLLTKFAALNTLASSDATAGVARALVVAHVLGRWSSVLLIRRYAYVRPAADSERPSAGRPFVAGVTGGRLVVATVIALVILNFAAGWHALPPLIVAIVVTAAAGWYFDRRIGGITGDALGAANQIVEVCVYLTLAARLS